MGIHLGSSLDLLPPKIGDETSVPVRHRAERNKMLAAKPPQANGQPIRLQRNRVGQDIRDASDLVSFAVFQHLAWLDRFHGAHLRLKVCTISSYYSLDVRRARTSPIPDPRLTTRVAPDEGIRFVPGTVVSRLGANARVHMVVWRMDGVGMFDASSPHGERSDAARSPISPSTPLPAHEGNQKIRRGTLIPWVRRDSNASRITSCWERTGGSSRCARAAGGRIG